MDNLSRFSPVLPGVGRGRELRIHILKQVIHSSRHCTGCWAQLREGRRGSSLPLYLCGKGGSKGVREEMITIR